MDCTPDLSVVVLCYRSEENVIPIIEKLESVINSHTNNYELILIGNYIPGMKDKTKEIVEEIARNKKNIKAIAKPKEGMMGWDMLEGLKASTGEYICVIDGDGQFPLDSVGECFKYIREKEADLVKTYRKKRYDGIYRIIVSKIYNIMFSILFPGLKSRDINSKPKIIKRSSFEKMKLQSTDWFIDAEIMINVRRHRMKIYEFPIEFYDIKRSSFVKAGAVFEFIRNLIVFRIKEFRTKK